MNNIVKPLSEVATVIRSKNAGPFELTLDIIFPSRAQFLIVKDTGMFSKAMIAGLYHCKFNDILDIIYFENAYAIKIVLKRDIPAGSIGDHDVYGAQQHAPLLSIDVPISE